MGLFSRLLSRWRTGVGRDETEPRPSLPTTYHDLDLGWSLAIPREWRITEEVYSTNFFAPDYGVGINVTGWNLLAPDEAEEQFLTRRMELGEKLGYQFRPAKRVTLGQAPVEHYKTFSDDLHLDWYMLHKGHMALMICACAPEEHRGQYRRLFNDILATLVLPESELPWALSLDNEQYVLAGDLEVEENLEPAGRRWGDHELYRYRSGPTKPFRISIRRGSTGLFQVYEERSFAQVRERGDRVALDLGLKSYLAGKELANVRLILERLRREAIRELPMRYGIKADFSPDSLEEIDRLLVWKKWRNQQRSSNAYLWSAGLIGAYFAEVVRREVPGATWYAHRPYWRSELVKEGRGSLEPFGLMVLAFHSAEEISLAAVLRALKAGDWSAGKKQVA